MAPFFDSIHLIRFITVKVDLNSRSAMNENSYLRGSGY